jgi:peptidyl-prolyl cis-trans isomerase D
MLAFFRNISKSWVAKVFMGLLVVCFSIWGIKDVFHPAITTSVITAGAHTIEPPEFKQMFEVYRKQTLQQTGQMITAQDAVAQGVDLRILQDLSSDEAMAEYIRRLGVVPSEKLIGDALKQQPLFFDKVSGKFDEKAYEQTLSENGLTPERFEASLHDEIAQNHLGAGMAAGLKEPLAYGALVASYELESRTLSYFLLSPNNVPPPTPPTDQQLQAFISQHADQLRRPETRLLTVVRFSAKALSPTLTPDPAEVQKIYDFRKDSLSTPEKRTLVEFPARDAGQAQAIAAKLQNGASPDDVAKAFSVRPVAYTDAPKSAVADPKVADAAFQLAPGQVSGPVQTALAGLAVIKVTGVTPAKAASFADAKPQIEAQARDDLAKRKIYESVQKYDDAHSTGATLAEAAKAAGASTAQFGPVSAQGADMKGQPIPALTPKLLKEAFGLAQGGETDLEDDGAGEYFAVHVDKIIPPAVPPLDDIRQPLTNYWMSMEMVKRLNAKADELSGKIRKGETLEAAAAEVGAQVGHAVAVTRVAMMQNKSLGQELGAKLFMAKAGDIVTGQTSQIPVMVARIDSINPANTDEAARMVVAQRNRGSMQMFNDLGQLARNTAKAVIKPTYDLDRARTAMGVSPDDLPKLVTSGAKPAIAP